MITVCGMFVLQIIKNQPVYFSVSSSWSTWPLVRLLIHQSGNYEDLKSEVCKFMEFHNNLVLLLSCTNKFKTLAPLSKKMHNFIFKCNSNFTFFPLNKYFPSHPILTKLHKLFQVFAVALYVNKFECSP